MWELLGAHSEFNDHMKKSEDIPTSLCQLIAFWSMGIFFTTDEILLHQSKHFKNLLTSSESFKCARHMYMHSLSPMPNYFFFCYLRPSPSFKEDMNPLFPWESVAAGQSTYHVPTDVNCICNFLFIMSTWMQKVCTTNQIIILWIRITAIFFVSKQRDIQRDMLFYD
jgi:hypothetical protein